MNARHFLIPSAILCLIIYLGACGSSETKSASGDNSAGQESSVAEGKEVYERYCVLCHGNDGKLAINGAKDITISQLTEDERITLIRQGKGLMTPFEGVLTESQIAAVSSYSMTLK